LPQATDDLQAAESRKREVQNQQRRFQLKCLAQGVGTVIQFCDDAMAVYLEYLAYAMTKKWLFVGDQDLAHSGLSWLEVRSV
jgi:hypothetical protein